MEDGGAWPEGSLEQFIRVRCEDDNDRVMEIMDKIRERESRILEPLREYKKSLTDYPSERQRLSMSAEKAINETPTITQGEMQEAANQAIGDKIGYYKDEQGVVDIVIEAIFDKLNGG